MIQKLGKPLGLARAFRIFIGITELFTAVGLILPGMTHILPWLTPLAATGLVIVMVCSVIYHQRRGETKNIRSSGIALLIVLFVVLICMFVRFVYQYPAYTKNTEERENEFYQ